MPAISRAKKYLPARHVGHLHTGTIHRRTRSRLRHLFSGTVRLQPRARAHTAPAPASFSEVIRAAKLACIHDEIMGLQDGYQTRVGKHGKNLSGGQRQRRHRAGAPQP